MSYGCGRDTSTIRTETQGLCYGTFDKPSDREERPASREPRSFDRGNRRRSAREQREDQADRDRHDRPGSPRAIVETQETQVGMARSINLPLPLTSAVDKASSGKRGAVDVADLVGATIVNHVDHSVDVPGARGR